MFLFYYFIEINQCLTLGNKMHVGFGKYNGCYMKDDICYIDKFQYLLHKSKKLSQLNF